MKTPSEVKYALFLILGLLLLYFGIKYLKSESVLSSSRDFYAVYDNVNGLKEGDPVMIQGFNIGKVVRLSILNEKKKIIVKFVLFDEEAEFSKNSVVELNSLSLMGDKSLEIIPLVDEAPIASQGDTLKTLSNLTFGEMIKSQVDPSLNKFNTLISNTDTTISTINGLLNNQTKTNFINTVENLQQTSSNLKKITGLLNAKLNTHSGNIDDLVIDTKSFLSDLNKLDIQESVILLNRNLILLDSILLGLNQGRGTLGKLLKDDRLYEKLVEVSGELKLLTEDIRINPKRYTNFSVFEKKDKGYNNGTH